MPNLLLTKVVAKQMRQVPEFRPGDTIRVHVKIKDATKSVSRLLKEPSSLARM